ncbi:integrase, catalytic region, zinc finger, CCHC-type containing protein [Tanacetum coccineum]
MLHRPHGRMILLASVEKGPHRLAFNHCRWKQQGLREYIELTKDPAEAIQADCDIKAINIILQGLPTKIYALVSQHRVAKDLWEKIKLLMQGTSLTKQERECKLYDEFDKFTYKKGDRYMIHTMRVHFVTPYQTQQFTTSQSTPLSITYPSNEYQSSVQHNVYSPQSSIPQLEYAPTTYQHQQSEFSQPDSGLIVPVFQKGDDPIDAINHMMSFLTAVVTSWYPTTNNQLRTSSNPRQQATIYDGKVTVQPVQGRQTTYAAGTTRKYTPGASGSNTGKQRTVICYNCKGEGHISKQCTKPKRKRDETWFNDKVLLVHAKHVSTKIALMVNLSRNGSDALTEVHNLDNLAYDLINQSNQNTHRLESKTFEVKMNQVLRENERLLAQAIDHDIIKTVVNLSMNDGCEIVNECQKCLELKTELLNKKDVVDKETYDKLSQPQAKDTVIVKLKEQIKSLKGNVDDSKVKMDMDKIETLNIELESRNPILSLSMGDSKCSSRAD